MGEYAKNNVKRILQRRRSTQRSVDVEIAIRLKEENIKVEKYVHSYPHC
jgi:isoleucyl-tRNA synthetase